MQLETLELNKDEFQRIIESFKGCANNGMITEEQFRKVLLDVVGERTQSVDFDKWWKCFELHGSNKAVDFVEVVIGLSVFFNGSFVDSIFLQFDMMDEDSSGTIDLEEMKKFFRRNFEVQARMGGYTFQESRWREVIPYLERSFKSAGSSRADDIHSFCLSSSLIY
jgi:Ca2+-binding EF-hand superfamily protein